MNTKKVVMALMPFVMAAGVVVAGNLSKNSQSTQPGFELIGSLCDPTDIPDNCQPDNPNQVCENLHLVPGCNDVLRLP